MTHERAASDQASAADRDRLGPPLLECRDMWKSFGGARALHGASLSIGRAGTVMGLLGQNGSGKSTLLNIISGQLSPDAGILRLDGTDVAFRSPADALRRGIVMVSQETSVATSLSIAENVFLGGRMPKVGGRISWPATVAAARGVLEQLGLDYDPRATVGELRPDQQQLVEIGRAVSQDARVLILDEPTSSLSENQVAALFRTIRRLRSAGVSVLFVSHRLPEVLEICDELAVLRDGRTVASAPIEEFDADAIVSAMVGDDVAAEPHSPAVDDRHDARPSAPAPGSEDPAPGLRPPTAQASAALRVDSLSCAGVLSDVTFEVHEGEIVGLAGLLGSGRNEILEVLFGLRPKSTGAIQLYGNPYAPSSPEAAIALSVGYLPPDRKLQGLVLCRPVAENLMMAATNRLPRLKRLRRAREAGMVADIMSQVQIKAASAWSDVSSLSGGNQQKVAIGKWLASHTRLALFDEPTRGVDVAAKAEIHQVLKKAARNGMTLLVSSSENDEILSLCDRVIVLYRGQVVGEEATSSIDEEWVAARAGGHDG